MKNLLSGLEELGFADLDELDVFKADGNSGDGAVNITSNAINPAEFIYDKNYDCPVCEKKFKEKAVKSSKLRFQKLDIDLMPRYTPISPFYYNVIICPHCGYASLSDDFLKIAESQCTLIKNQITPRFKPKQYPVPLTEDSVIERYKFALLNSVVKRGRICERSYICLVISWLYKLKDDEENRLLFTKNAFEGFVAAYGKEAFPFYGMNEIVTSYLIGELAMCLGDNEAAIKWLSRVLGSRLATSKVKDMALELKTKIAKQNRLA